MLRIRSKDGAAIWLSVVTAVSFVGGGNGRDVFGKLIFCGIAVCPAPVKTAMPVDPDGRFSP
jgi:hypothetical protein